MLESPGLLLRPWTAPAPEPHFGLIGNETANRFRDIAAVVDNRPLGFAVRRPGTRWRRLPWLARPCIEVYETEDASLLCTAQRRRWSRSWDVADAEGRAVGAFRSGVFRLPAHTVRLWNLREDSDHSGPKYPGTVAADWLGRLVAWIEAPALTPSRVIAPDGVILATLTRTAHGTILVFTPSWDGTPFAKMLLLTAVLLKG